MNSAKGDDLYISKRTGLMVVGQKTNNGVNLTLTFGYKTNTPLREFAYLTADKLREGRRLIYLKENQPDGCWSED